MRILVPFGLLLLVATSRAEEQGLDARVAKLEAEVERLNKALDEERAARESQATFRVGRFAVGLAGFLQADAVAYSQASADEIDFSTGQPLNETRFYLRRARLGISADYRIVSVYVEFDANTTTGPVARISAGDVSIRWPSKRPDAPPYVMGSLGLLRIPFGFEVQELDYVRLFLERSNMAKAFFPGEFDLGVRAQGGYRILRYQVAVMNGHPSGDKQFALRDPTHSKDVLGRVGIDVHVGRLHLTGGFSALWGTGFSVGRPATKDGIVWHDTNNDGQVDPTEITGVPGQPAVASQTFTRYAVGADLRVTVDVPKIGELALYGECTWATNLDRGLMPADPVNAGRDLRELGWYVALTQQLTKWAAIGIRYDRYDPDADASEQVAAMLVPRDRTFSTLSVVAAAMYAPYARLSLEYDHNQNALGRTASGAPTTLGSNVVTFRGQVVY
jgi:hypothetical protein